MITTTRAITPVKQLQQSQSLSAIPPRLWMLVLELGRPGRSRHDDKDLAAYLGLSYRTVKRYFFEMHVLTGLDRIDLAFLGREAWRMAGK